MRLLRLTVLLCSSPFFHCSSSGSASSDGGQDPDGVNEFDGGVESARVHVVLFTHIEDNMPSGALESLQNRKGYLVVRAKLIAMAELARSYKLQWVLQPDWKILEAALLYEDTETTANTKGKNFLRYLRDDLGVVIDPHSHESDGYNYTDVAYLLDLLEVGGSTVIGGHIWDPDIKQFQEWDRFRKPVGGLMYPKASWRGDILIGAGSPNHTNDPLVSGVWRPQDRDHFFIDDPEGNIVAVGAWHEDAAGVQELVDLYVKGKVPPEVMLTASWNITPATITAANGLADIEKTTLAPIATLRDQGLVVATDFTTLTKTWASAYDSNATLWQP